MPTVWKNSCVRAAEEDTEALCVTCARVDELTAERASLTAGTENAKTKCDTLTTLICKLDAVAATRDGEPRLVRK